MKKKFLIFNETYSFNNDKYCLIIRQKMFTANQGNQKNNPTIDNNKQNENRDYWKFDQGQQNHY